MSTYVKKRSISRNWIIAIILVVLFVVITSELPIFESLPFIWGKISIFTTVFLGIFIEAVPFLLLGTLGSGFVEAFLDHDQIRRLIPRKPLPGAIVGSLLGMIFPICECGVVPLTRRLYSKGLPVTAGIAFLLAAPVLNPIVILSTSAAFGWGWMLFGRVGLSMLMAVLIGLLFSVVSSSADLMLSSKNSPQSGMIEHLTLAEPAPKRSFWQKLNLMAVIAGDEFFEMGRYLVLGATLASLMQALIPQQVMLQLGHGPVTSVLVMLGLAVILSICSTVDAFVVLGFASTFSPGAILAFLIFGPMVDIKTTLMYLSVFKKRTVLYLILLPFAMSFLAGLILNLVII